MYSIFDLQLLFCLFVCFCFFVNIDPNSVFKAKEKRDEEKGASEVQDTNDTVTELPIDQVAAEEVEEEDNLKEDIQPDEDDKVVDKTPSKSPEVEEEDVPEEVVEAEEQVRRERSNCQYL